MMKKILVLSLTVFFSVAVLFLNAQQSTYSQKSAIYAVVVGISGYKDPNFRGLKFAEKDARDFYDFLLSPASGSVPKENISLLIGSQATRGNILKAMVNQYIRAEKQDVVIFYFSGHGKNGETETSGYFIGYDTEEGSEVSTAITMNEVRDKLDQAQAKVKLSYIDACHAGMFKSIGSKGDGTGNRMIKTYMNAIMNAAQGSAGFMSCKANQESGEDSVSHNGIFTHFLLKGLKGEADKERVGAPGVNDKIVTVGEMDTYLNNKISAYTLYKQQPYVLYNCEENFPLSVLTPNASLGDLMAKSYKVPAAPKADPATVDAAKADPPKKEKQDNTADKQIPKNECISNYNAYGSYCFINNLKEPILLYYISPGTQCTLILPPGERVCSPRIYVSQYADNAYRTLSIEPEFFFKTLDESKPIKYGTLKLLVLPCVQKTMELMENNLYLATNGRKL